MTDEFYNQILNICIKYFPDSGQLFLDRQINSHLNKNSGDLSPDDKNELAKWVRISSGLLLSIEKAEAFKKEILES